MAARRTDATAVGKQPGRLAPAFDLGATHTQLLALMHRAERRLPLQQLVGGDPFSEINTTADDSEPGCPVNQVW
jgi:hypothetical protein